MATAQSIQQALQHVNDQKSFIQRLLIDELGWNIDVSSRSIRELSFEWGQDDLFMGDHAERIVDGQVWQIRPFEGDGGWAVFVIEFQDEAPVTGGRGLMGPLRKSLTSLIRAGRRNPDLPQFNREQMLFLCTHEYRHFRFAWFRAPREEHLAAPIATFSWSAGDTAIRTVSEYNLRALQSPNTNGRWQQAFDIERVTKEFYREYEDVFSFIRQHIARVNGLEEDPEENTTEENDRLQLATQTLMNRLMFIRFVEKKGWFSFNGSIDYLRALYKAGDFGDQSFFQGRLSPLSSTVWLWRASRKPSATAASLSSTAVCSSGTQTPIR